MLASGNLGVLGEVLKNVLDSPYSNTNLSYITFYFYQFLRILCFILLQIISTLLLYFSYLPSSLATKLCVLKKKRTFKNIVMPQVFFDSVIFYQHQLAFLFQTANKCISVHGQGQNYVPNSHFHVRIQSFQINAGFVQIFQPL